MIKISKEIVDTVRTAAEIKNKIIETRSRINDSSIKKDAEGRQTLLHYKPDTIVYMFDKLIDWIEQEDA